MRGVGMKYCAVVLLLLLTSGFSDVLIYDDFEDGTADGWLEMPGASYEVSGGRYHFSHSAADTVIAGSLTGDIFGSMSAASYSIRTEIEIDYGDITGVLGRFDLFGMDGYVVTLITEMGGLLAISRMDNGQIQILAYTLISIVPGQEYWVRFELNEHLLGAKVWTGDVSDEPGYWQLTVSDSTYPDPGSVGLIALDESTGGTAQFSVWFDEFLVEDDLSLDLGAHTWSSIKAVF